MSLNYFKQHFLPLKNKLYRLALRITGASAEAEDVVQEVFLKIWRRQEEWKRINNPEAWCLQTTRNLSIDKLRSNHRRPGKLNEPDLQKGAAPTPERIVETIDLLQKIRDRMNALPENQKLVMQLRDIEGFSYKEISEALDMPLNQVKTNLFRARKQIRAYLIKTASYGLS